MREGDLGVGSDSWLKQGIISLPEAEANKPQIDSITMCIKLKSIIPEKHLGKTPQ